MTIVEAAQFVLIVNVLFLIVNIRNARRNAIVARTTARLQGKGDIFDSVGGVAGKVFANALRSHINPGGLVPLPTPTPNGGKKISK